MVEAWFPLALDYPSHWHSPKISTGAETADYHYHLKFVIDRITVLLEGRNVNLFVWDMFSPSRGKMLLWDQSGPKPKLVPFGVELIELDHYCSSDVCISPGDCSSNEMSSHVERVRLAYKISGYRQRRWEFRSLLIEIEWTQDSDIWYLCSENIQLRHALDNRYFPNMDNILSGRCP